MIHLYKHRYEYMEEINEGVIKYIPQNITSNSYKVLDVGCGGGALAEAIKKKNYKVWGIESHQEACNRASQRIDKVIREDLTHLKKIKEKIGNEKFDIVVFSDVLEHLYDPFSVLREYLEFLKKGGKVIVSVPNAVNWINRIKFLLGMFNYNDTGVMDRTHIRFFTFKTASEIIKESGCIIKKLDYTPFIVRAFLPIIKNIFLNKESSDKDNRRQIIDSPMFKFYMKYIYPLEYIFGLIWKPLFAFRIIVIGEKLSD